MPFFSIDPYLSSLAQTVVELSSSSAHVQHTISVFLAGLCLGIRVYGPLSDRYGRRPLLLESLMLYGLATMGCLFAANIEQLIAWPFSQALGGAGAILHGEPGNMFPKKAGANVALEISLQFAFGGLASRWGSRMADVPGSWLPWAWLPAGVWHCTACASHAD